MLQLFFHDPDNNMVEICNCDCLPIVPLDNLEASSTPLAQQSRNALCALTRPPSLQQLPPITGNDLVTGRVRDCWPRMDCDSGSLSSSASAALSYSSSARCATSMDI